MLVERIFTPFRIATLVGVLLALFRVVGCSSLDRADMRAMDYRLLQRGRQPAAPEVVVVAVDDRSVAEIGRWPWPRAVMARLIDRLVAADAAVIGFDVVQSESTAAQSLEGIRARVEGVDDATWQRVRTALSEVSHEDEILVDAVARSQRTVLGYFVIKPDAAHPVGDAADAATLTGRVSTFNVIRPSRDGSGEQFVPHAISMRANLPALTAAAREVGFFNVLNDPDGAVRRSPLAIQVGDHLALPLSLAMWHIYRPNDALQIQFEGFGVASLRAGRVDIPVSEDGQLLLNYRGPGRTIPHVAAVDLLAGRTPAEAIRNKLAVVGATATAVADVRVTPFDGVFPGVETHATVLDNILRNDFVWRPRWVLYIELAVIFYAVYSLAAALTTVSGTAGALGTLFMGTVYLVGSQWLFRNNGLVLSFVYPLLAITITYVTIALRQYVSVARQRRELRHALGLYLAPAVANLVSDKPEMLRLGGDKRELTVMFCDIRGFSSIAEQMGPHDLVELLHVYLGAMTDVVFAHDGTLDKYIGDAIMAFWGAPLVQPTHAEQACVTGLEMLACLDRLEAEWESRGWPMLAMGIGINTGEMVVGNMGSARRLSYTVAGDAVNIGSRLEGLTKVYGSRIIASEATIREVNGKVVTRELDIVRVKGRGTPIRIYEVLSQSGDEARWRSLRATFEAGLAAYRGRLWDEALALFEAALKERPNDKPSRVFMERCRKLSVQPPPPTWQGVTDFDTK